MLEPGLGKSSIPPGRALQKTEGTSIAAHSIRNLRPYALCGVIAPAFFALMVLIEQSVVPGYSWTSQYISDLGVYSLYGSYAIIQNVNFWASGILVFTFTLGLRRTLLGSRAVTASLGLFGIAEVLGGVFPDQPALPVPWGWSRHRFGCGSQHHLDMSVTCVEKAAAPRGRGGKYLGSIPNLLVCQWPTHVCSRFHRNQFLFLGMASQGVGQRVFLAVPWLWIEVTALKLFRLSRASPL
jgi:hypothetical protein